MDGAAREAAADAPEVAASDSTWRERAVERSLRNARAKAMSRSDRFISSAIEILTETGRTDFTVQELIERSKTSLRSFYQHFSGKEELLLALFEEIIATSAAQWRADVADMPDTLAALRFIVEMVHAQAVDPGAGDGGINRALSVYHLQLAESRPTDYARVLAPLRELILDLVKSGIDDGDFRDDIDADTLAMIMMQTIVGAAHMHALGSEPGGVPLGTEQLWQFCLGGLVGGQPASESAKSARRKR
ncbi:MAG TPA: TetR/AcrR family transcriptional regulator [Mycobacteriales bacterium]|nr:TetR/AcrR family transcriptional regulator [Mycobacteriales bacterium]